LKHEQYHYSLACALARKGTQAILGGATPADILRTVRTRSGTQTRSFDNDTQHGCDAAQQDTWEKAIRDGLPAVTIP